MFVTMIWIPDLDFFRYKLISQFFLLAVNEIFEWQHVRHSCIVFPAAPPEQEQEVGGGQGVKLPLEQVLSQFGTFPPELNRHPRQNFLVERILVEGG